MDYSNSFQQTNNQSKGRHLNDNYTKSQTEDLLLSKCFDSIVRIAFLQIDY